MALKDEIVEIAVDTISGIRKAIGQNRNTEFTKYIKDLIAAKEAGIDATILDPPLLNDKLRMQINAALSAKTKVGAEGGIEWTVIKATASYSKEQDTGASIMVEMDFSNQGEPELSAVQALSVDDLKKLQTILENAE